MRLPNQAAVDTFREVLDSGDTEMLDVFLLGVAEADGDLTTSPSDHDDSVIWHEIYDAGREVGRAALGRS